MSDYLAFFRLASGQALQQLNLVPAANQLVGTDADGKIVALTISEIQKLIFPVGFVDDYAGTAAPAGWLLCFGQAVSRTTYAALFAAIGTTYGAGDAATTFNLPDVRGRVVAGKDNMGGVSANRLTAPINGDNLGAAGGFEALISPQFTVASGGDAFAFEEPIDPNTSNVQPTIIMNKIIFAGA